MEEQLGLRFRLFSEEDSWLRYLTPAQVQLFVRPNMEVAGFCVSSRVSREVHVNTRLPCAEEEEEESVISPWPFH